jgi:hypothetical protein
MYYAKMYTNGVQMSPVAERNRSNSVGSGALIDAAAVHRQQQQRRHSILHKLSIAFQRHR